MISLQDLLRSRSLDLRVHPDVRVAPARLDHELAWAYHSDLVDPTPWLSGSGLLLTTLSQFARDSSNEELDAYVGRLAQCDVHALGVVRPGDDPLPPTLARSCSRYGVVLIDIAPGTPLLALQRQVDTTMRGERRQRAEWSAGAQRALARAALRPDGLDSVLHELEVQLGGWVALFDADGQQVVASTRSPLPSSAEREAGDGVRATLARGLRGSGRLSAGEFEVTLQTLGRAHRLRGVLAVGTPSALDVAGYDVLHSATALVSIALDQSQDLLEAHRQLRASLLELLLDGADGAARRCAEHVFGPLPGGPVRVLVVSGPIGTAAHVLERLAVRNAGSSFFAEHEGRLTGVVDHAKAAEVELELSALGCLVGCSSPGPLDGLRPALVEAERALRRASAQKPVVRFDDVAAHGMFRLLEASGGGEVARQLLAPLRQRPPDEQTTLLESAETWLRHKGSWDPAARELRVHRHTLRNRLDTIQQLLSLDLDQFDDRAELWSALKLLRVDGGAPRGPYDSVQRHPEDWPDPQSTRGTASDTVATAVQEKRYTRVKRSSRAADR